MYILCFFLTQKYFNSIKVRLDQKCRIRGKPLILNFNSIKVRLELVPPSSNVSRLTTFQFHKGTIRTNRWCPQCQRIRNFNSIKVRLEHRYLEALQDAMAHFNSIKVRLEPLCSFPFLSVRRDFNSIKVRLEHSL